VPCFSPCPEMFEVWHTLDGACPHEGLGRGMPGPGRASRWSAADVGEMP